MAFVDNLEYMLIGMVGIFAVIGVIMAVTVLLNKSSKGE
ncbi:MAG: oxaloacetate decarboxylase [Clostridia bacterium]|nr:oxaloacetate decarboxylase [Clostridia bacterium]